MTNFYRLTEESSQNLSRMIHLISENSCRGFIPRVEPEFLFTSQAMFQAADLQVATCMWFDRLDKSVDLVLTFNFTDVSLNILGPTSVRDSLNFIRQFPTLMELKHQVPHPTRDGRQMSTKAIGPNSIIIGQVDHYGDVEVLAANTLSTVFTGTQLRIEIISEEQISPKWGMGLYKSVKSDDTTPLKD